MTIQIGQTIPDIDITWVDATENPVQTTTAALFGATKAVLFGVPGAFTPTCSERHLPGYAAHMEHFRGRGVAVYCLSVNDAFVMKAWADSQQLPPGLKLLADGNAAFTRALGLEMDGTHYGMGLRSRRFALYAEEGVVRVLHIEAPGEFRVSAAEAMLAAIST